MKIKSLLIALAIALPFISVAQGYPMKITEMPPGSGFSCDYDTATDTWTLTCETNDGVGILPAFRLNAITEAVPSQYTSLCFEYRSTHDINVIDMVMYKVFLGSATKYHTFTTTMSATDEWKVFRADISALRTSNTTRFLNKAGQYQDIRFAGLPVGGAIQVRNIRYDENEFPFKEMNLNSAGENIIEAEDFNIAADKKGGHSVRNNQLPELNTFYTHPTGKYFPIYAWGSVDFNGGMGNDAPAFLQKQYQELWDCGFTITQGTAWPGVDNAFLFDGQEINGVKINLREGTELSMICKAGLSNYNEVKSTVTGARKSDRLGGWFIMDEPHRKHFPEMTQKVNWIREFDTDHILYGNLLNISTDMNAIGFTSYDEYVHTFMREVGTGFISYDYYPVRQYDDSKEIYIEPDFFNNLEIVSKLAKYYKTSFWAFAHSVASNCGKVGVSYPTPEEDHMRVQIFGNLAYGAQGVQYFTYKCPNPYGGYTYYDAPIDVNDQKTPVWYMVQNINRDIHALTWVFLGAEFLRAGHTNAETPVGCTRLTKDMLPVGINSVTSDGPGVCVSMLRNGKNLFMMVLNGDIHKTQNVTIQKDVAVKRVLMDGTTEADAAGEKTYELTPGHFVLYLVSEDEAVTEPAEVPFYEISDYRDDASDVFITADANASGGHYVAAMGDPRWDSYSAIIPTDGNRTISREQAIANWGSAFSYTVTVPTDMRVDISVKHSVPWSEYGRVAAAGVAPGYQYSIENDPTLNWPKQYAASMILSVDGNELTPADQPLRPSVPAVFAEDGAEFDAILADKDRWVSTKEADGSASKVLYFWPKAGGDNDVTAVYNEEPDYRGVLLTAGTHKLTVTSLCYPWHFDNLRIAPEGSQSAIDIIGEDMRETDNRIFNIMGVECREPLAPGIYIRNGRKFIVK